ncbi:Peptide methionine sulfoxide reductase MsrB [Porphyridium purpureum]|uniref:Peptide methionine sulfoxide reductase MsrB n=1 Tax=Porphyridium purpureum TaxID=35688 RepID=A0A5J4Z139_PORPP|nr:Peptide methionine sulfoxide reductase MsrB [Porphyridium purpureum]|eukprot:POR6219..scf208_2
MQTTCGSAWDVLKAPCAAIQGPVQVSWCDAGNEGMVETVNPRMDSHRRSQKGVFMKFSSKASAGSSCDSKLTPHSSGGAFELNGRVMTDKSENSSLTSPHMSREQSSVTDKSSSFSRSRSLTVRFSRDNSANAIVAPDIHRLPVDVCHNPSVRVVIKPRASNSKKRELTYSVMKLKRDDETWRELLDEVEYQALRKGNYEAPFKHLPALKGPTANVILFCRACDAPLFEGKDLVDMSEGYPKLRRSMVGILGNVLGEYRGMPRAEVHCKGCDSFVGSIENDFVTGSAVALVRRVLSAEGYAAVVPTL